MPGGTDRYYPHFANLYRWLPFSQLFNITSNCNKLGLTKFTIEGVKFKISHLNLKLFISVFSFVVSSCSVNLFGQIVLASNDAQNILYQGVQNPVSICAEGIPCGKLWVIANGKELKLKSCKTIITPDRQGIFIIEVFYKKKIIAGLPFRVLPLPQPVAKVGAIANGKITLKYLIACGGIRAFVLPNQTSIDVLVLSYDIIIVRKNGDMLRVENTGARYNEKTIEAFNQLTIGDRVLFSNIAGRLGSAETMIEPCELVIGE